MVSRKRKLPQRYDGGVNAEEEESETVHVRRASEAGTRTTPVGRMPTRSDIVVEKSPDDRGASSKNRKVDRETGNDTPKVRGGKQSDVTPVPERERMVTLDVLGMKSGKETGGNTPVRSVNGSVSGTSTAHKPHRINTRSQGTSRFSIIALSQNRNRFGRS
jgi:hypothetical protein